MGPDPADLPYVDEHASDLPAPPDAVWAALGRTVRGMLSGRAGTLAARLLGSADAEPAAKLPLREGTALVGFHVAVAEPPRRLVLAGRHRFSSYALGFAIEPLDLGARSRLRAETRAEFPGLHGRAYRALVIGTRMHVLAVRLTLRRVERRLARA